MPRRRSIGYTPHYRARLWHFPWWPRTLSSTREAAIVRNEPATEFLCPGKNHLFFSIPVKKSFPLYRFTRRVRTPRMRADGMDAPFPPQRGSGRFDLRPVSPFYHDFVSTSFQHHFNFEQMPAHEFSGSITTVNVPPPDSKSRLSPPAPIFPNILTFFFIFSIFQFMLFMTLFDYLCLLHFQQKWNTR